MTPTEAVPDEHSAVSAIVFEKLNYVAETGKFENTGETETFPARTVCVAAGTAPNVIYEKEFPGTFQLDEWRQFFEPFEVAKNGDGKTSRQTNRKPDFSLHMKKTENSFPITATITRRLPETSSKRWLRRKTVIRKSSNFLKKKLRHAANSANGTRSDFR